MIRPRNPETEAEFNRLKEHYPQLREVMSPEAILAAWFLCGDDMWKKTEPEAEHGE